MIERGDDNGDVGQDAIGLVLGNVVRTDEDRWSSLPVGCWTASLTGFARWLPGGVVYPSA